MNSCSATYALHVAGDLLFESTGSSNTFGRFCLTSGASSSCRVWCS